MRRAQVPLLQFDGPAPARLQARWREKAAREHGAMHKDWGGRVPIALVYPNSYYVGMSSVGFQSIYSAFNQEDGLVCERFFWECGRQGWQPGQVSPLSVESGRPIGDFGILAFSISYELDYWNVVQFLKASGIPLAAQDRQDGDPLVIAGGSCVFSNPEPLAPLFDAFCLGEAEPILPGLTALFTEWPYARREELLAALAAMPGIYTPHWPQEGPVERLWARDLDAAPAHSLVFTPDTEFGDMFLLEISRGCGWACRFCSIGYIMRPPRARSLEQLLKQAEWGLQYRRRIGLIAATVTNHPQIDDLLEELHRRGAGISLSSLRLEKLTETMVRCVLESGTRTVTLAPEVGSQRLRRYISKNASLEEILEATDKVARFQVPNLKYYFMVGLPTETDEDVEEIINLVMDCQRVIEKRRANTRIALNVSPFVPKPQTPFQWMPVASREEVSRRLQRIQTALRPRGVDVRSDGPQWYQVEAILSRGDGRLASVLAAMPEHTLAAWRRALGLAGLDEAALLRGPRMGDPLPWERIDVGLRGSYLAVDLRKQEKRESLAFVCPPDHECHQCGVC